MEKINGLPPVIAPGCRVLLLGSMPGQVSLEKREYYAHPRNDFWPIIFSLLQLPLPFDYQKRQDLILKRGIALWDVLKTCQRNGSSDSSIRAGELNDFSTLFNRNNSIRAVFFNGKKAGDLFNTRGGYLPRGTNSFYLPSSSPAHTISRREKLEAWKRILVYLD